MHGELAIVARTGRKRKIGRRKPCGRLIQDELENREGPTLVRRVLDRLYNEARDPAYGSVIGRMLVSKEISAVEFNAGCKFAALRARADQALGLPPRNPKALDYNAARGLSLHEPDPEWVQEVKRALEAAEEALGGTLPAIEHVVVEDRLPADHCERLAVKCGLKCLVQKWRLVVM